MAVSPSRILTSPALCIALAALSGCINAPTDESAARSLAAAQRDTGAYTGATLTTRSPAEQQTTGSAPETPLPAPLSQAAAVDLMLRQSPAVQELLALAVAGQHDAEADARPFSLGAGITRDAGEDGIAYSRSLSLNLMELVTWPARRALADEKVQLRQLALARDIALSVTGIRHAWVDTIAASQRRQWAEQARESAAAGAELAQRLQHAGNISTAEQLTINETLHRAEGRLDEAVNAERDARYHFVRLTGLTSVQAERLQLPSRFPALPHTPPTTDALAHSVSDARLDIRLARQQLRLAATAAGLTDIASLGDAELGLENSPGSDKATALSLTVPVFDAGLQQRAASDQRTLAATHALTGAVRHSALRSEHAWATWKQRYDTAIRYRDRIIPERVTLSGETLKRYNGMLIDVFTLLEDAQTQVDTLYQALEAEAAFWRADIELQAALFGLEDSASSDKRPTSGDLP